MDSPFVAAVAALISDVAVRYCRYSVVTRCRPPAPWPGGTGVFVVTEAIVLLRLEEDTAAGRRRDKLVVTADAVKRA